MRTALLCSALVLGGVTMASGDDKPFADPADLPLRPAMPDPLTRLDGSKGEFPLDPPVSIATGDGRANPVVQFEALKSAGPAYRLMGAEGIDPDTPMPPTGPIVGDRLGYKIRPGKHAMTPEDWPVCLDFADGHLGRE